MNDTVMTTKTAELTTARLTLIQRIAKNLLFKQLRNIEHGQLTIADYSGSETFGQLSSDFDKTAILTVHDTRAYTAIAFGGSIGAGESYMQHYWSVDNLTDLVRIFVRNIDVLDDMDSGFSYMTAMFNKIYHKLNKNTVSGSKKNISAHYDIGNDLYQLFLDETMMYSSAIYENEDMDLKQASEAKLDRICKKLDLQPDDHVIEIGSGWGGFAIHAAKNYGCRVTTTTISRQQYELALQRIQQQGLQDKITVLLKDYRELEGQYDKLVSIEMIEAVGHEYYKSYFQQCSRLLKPEGLMLIQAITIADQRYSIAKRSVDFIQRYIFPGGCLPSVSVIGNMLSKFTDMRIYHLEDIGLHYAQTLKHWRDNFFDKLDHVTSLGYSQSFIRMWEYYLCYCEGGFKEQAIGCVQVLMTKPRANRVPLVPKLG